MNKTPENPTPTTPTPETPVEGGNTSPVDGAPEKGGTFFDGANAGTEPTAPVNGTEPTAPDEGLKPVLGEEGYLYAGKYKTVEEFEAGHKGLMGMLTDKDTQFAPTEAYSTDAAKEAGLDFGSEEVWTATEAELRKVNLTQTQFDGLAPVMKGILDGQAVQFQEKFNKALDEYGLVSKDDFESSMTQWGGDFASPELAEEKSKQIAAWAQNHLTPDVWSKPLQQTYEGMKFIQKLMEGRAGVAPITDQTAPKAKLSKDQLQFKMKEIIASDAYKNDDPVAAKELREVSTAINSL